MKQGNPNAILSPFILIALAMVLAGCDGIAPQSSQAEKTALADGAIQVAPATEAAVTEPTQAMTTGSAGDEVVAKEIVSDSFPLPIENCGLTYTYEAPPKRSVILNQAATEIMLALGLEEHMIGTAYLDDEILPEYQAAYEKIPVLAKEYPSQEVLFAAEPDFVYGSYSSAFEDEAAGSREELSRVGIASYVSPAACADKTLRPNPVTIDAVYSEIRDIGHIFGIGDRAEALITEMQAKLAAVKAKIGPKTKLVKVFWFDSEDKGAYTGACCGAPNEIIKLAGAENIFADVEGSWATVSWEEVVARNPEAIVLTQAEWSTAEEKIALLKNTSAYANIAAVQREHFIIIPFSATSPGIRNVSAVEDLARGLYPEKFE